jgi:hypothetical protein
MAWLWFVSLSSFVLCMIAEKAEYMAAAGPELRQVRCQWLLRLHLQERALLAAKCRAAHVC